jgi:hypothetical protein
MAFIPVLHWLLAHDVRGAAAAPCAPLPLTLSAAEARVNAELPLHRRSSDAALLGGRAIQCCNCRPLAALLRQASPTP